MMITVDSTMSVLRRAIGRFDYIVPGRHYKLVITLLGSRMRPVDGSLISMIGPRRREGISTAIFGPP